MRLSKKGWNNVLIFGVLIILILFNFSQKLMQQPKTEQRTVIGNQQMIVEIKTPDFSIKRSGRSWISEPNLGLSEQQLSLLVQNWQNHPLQIQAAILNPENLFIIHVYTADKAQPITVKLIQQDDHYLLQTDDEISLFLSDEQLPLFIGR